MRLYFTLNEYLKNLFGEKVWKVPVDAGFTCPNIDGEKGSGGCTYCSNDAFVHVDAGEISDQVRSRIAKLEKKKINKFIVYFQSYSNTYGSLNQIRSKIEASLIDDRIVGIHIGTRPDVIDSEKLRYLAELSDKYDVILELGLQSIHDKTLKRINRGHTFFEFDEALKLCRSFGIKVCAHVILGLPGETTEEMLETVKYLASQQIDSVKFHHLYIVKGTAMANEYGKGMFKLLEEDEYSHVLADALTLLPENTVVARLVGSGPHENLIAPEWPRVKLKFLNELHLYMKQNGLYQGKNYIHQK